MLDCYSFYEISTISEVEDIDLPIIVNSSSFLDPGVIVTIISFGQFYKFEVLLLNPFKFYIRD